MKRLVPLVILIGSGCASMPSDPVQLFRMATNTLTRKGDTARALLLLDRAIEQDPGYLDALNLRGAVHRLMGDHDLAIADYETMKELRPDYALPHLNLGVLFEEKGRYADAERAYSEAIRLLPEYVEALLHRSRLYRTMGRNDESDKDLARARVIGERMAAEFYNRGVHSYNRGRTEDAERALKFALQLRPEFYDARIALGGVYLQMKSNASALEQFDLAVKLDGSRWDAHFYRGSCLLALGDPEKAIAALSRAIEIRPRNPQPYILRGVIRHRHLGEKQEAEEDYRTALRLRPDADDAYEGLAQLYQEEELFSDAEREYIRALSLRATPKRLRLLAQMYVDSDQGGKAVEAYKVAIKLCTEDSLKNVLERELADLKREGEKPDEKPEN